ncbi:MAG: hypothetical protein ACTSPV_18775, partial [Candidatus Hodarchaeales archaeon]
MEAKIEVLKKIQAILAEEAEKRQEPYLTAPLPEGLLKQGRSVREWYPTPTIQAWKELGDALRRGSEEALKELPEGLREDLMKLKHPWLSLTKEAKETTGTITQATQDTAQGLDELFNKLREIRRDIDSGTGKAEAELTLKELDEAVDNAAKIILSTWEDIRGLSLPSKDRIQEWVKGYRVDVKALLDDLEKNATNILSSVFPDMIRDTFIVPMEKGLQKIPEVYREGMTQTEIRTKFLHDLIVGFVTDQADKVKDAITNSLGLSNKAIQALFEGIYVGKDIPALQAIQDKIAKIVKEAKGRITPEVVQKVYASLAEDEKEVVDAMVKGIAGVIEAYTEADDVVKVQLEDIDVIVQTYVKRVNELRDKGQEITDATEKAGEEQEKQIKKIQKEWTKWTEVLSEFAGVVSASGQEILDALQRGINTFAGFLSLKVKSMFKFRAQRGTEEDFKSFLAFAESQGLGEIINIWTTLQDVARKKGWASKNQLETLKKLAEENVSNARELLQLFLDFLDLKPLWELYATFYQELDKRTGEAVRIFRRPTTKANALILLSEEYQRLSKENLLTPEGVQRLRAVFEAAYDAIASGSIEVGEDLEKFFNDVREKLQDVVQKYRLEVDTTSRDIKQLLKDIDDAQEVFYSSLEDIFTGFSGWVLEANIQQWQEEQKRAIDKFLTSLRDALRTRGIWKEIGKELGLFFSVEDVQEWLEKEIREQGLRWTGVAKKRYLALMDALKGMTSEQIKHASQSIQRFLQLILDAMEETEETIREFANRYQDVVGKIPTS